MSARGLLSYWFSLARLRDESGLPIDLMYYHLERKGALPRVLEAGTSRLVTEDEFQQGIKDCIAVLQNRSPRGLDLQPEDLNYLREQLT